jgi:hypothetical protein
MKRLVMLLLLSALVAALPAAASTFIHMDQKDLVRASAAVVQGRVISTNSYWNKTGQVIVTDAFLQVEDTIFGETPSVVVVHTFGGTVGGFTVDAEGFPKFQVNERLLLFLEPEKEGSSRVAGYLEGMYRIVREPSGIERAVPAAITGGGLVVDKQGRQVAAPRTLSLETLKSSIREDARRAGRTLEN